MLQSHNILNPANGAPITVPSQCKLLLNSIVGVSVNYRIVMVGHKIHRTFAVIFNYLVSDTI